MFTLLLVMDDFYHGGKLLLCTLNTKPGEFTVAQANVAYIIEPDQLTKEPAEHTEVTAHLTPG